MRIVYVCDEYPPAVAGGIGTAVAVLARGMVEAGHRVSVVGFYDRRLCPQERSDCDQGVLVYRYPHSTGSPVSALASRWRLRKILREMHRRAPIDVIEWPDYGGRYLAGIHGMVDIVKVHGGWVSHRVHGLGPRRRGLEYLELRMLRVIRNWIGVSQWFNNEWREFTKSPPRRGNNCLQSSRYRRLYTREVARFKYCRLFRRLQEEKRGSRLSGSGRDVPSGQPEL